MSDHAQTLVAEVAGGLVPSLLLGIDEPVDHQLPPEAVNKRCSLRSTKPAWGVYGPQGDSFLLQDSLRKASVPLGDHVLDVCTGTGLIAMAVARLGARRVHAVDTCYRAVLSARCNAWRHRLPVRVEHGDFSSCPAAASPSAPSSPPAPPWLTEQRLIEPGQKEEELVVIRADRPSGPITG